MAYNEKLANRIREALQDLPDVEEKKMFSGLAFLVNGKMCVNVSHDEMMCRIDPEKHEEALSKRGSRTMEMNGRSYIGYVKIAEEGLKTKKEFDYWINLALEFNSKAKSSKKKKK